MAKFCGKCGARLDEKTGLCPNCHANELNQERQSRSENQLLNQKQAKIIDRQTEKKAEKANEINNADGNKSKGCLLKLLIGIFVLLLIVLGIRMLLFKFGVTESIFFLHHNSHEEFNLEGLNANSYFDEKASNLIAVLDANDTDQAITETDTFKALSERGFQNYPITTEYSINGDYSEASEISSTSSEKHPIYKTIFISSAGDIWTIFVINGQMIANPVSYNLQSDSTIQVIVAEDEVITSYDSATNSFYQTIPKETELDVIVVDEINDDTLEALTFDIIELS